MKKMKNIKVGDVVQFPYYQFAPYRSGWNGWLFKTAIVTRLYTSTKGFKCAELVYQTNASVYTEDTYKIRCDYLFDGDADWIRRSYLDGIKIDGFELLEAHGMI